MRMTPQPVPRGTFAQTIAGQRRATREGLDEGVQLSYGQSIVDPIAQPSVLALNEQDRAVVGRVEQTIADGRALKRWQAQADASNSYAERYELIREFNPSNSSYAFLDEVALDGRVMPVMGSVDEALYDQPKHAGGRSVQDEFREYVMHYFMRVAAYQPPEAFVVNERHPPYTRYLRRLSWCPEERDTRTGFGFSQQYYKLRGSGVTGKFPEEQQSRIVDLREIGEKYEWIVLKVQILQFNVSFKLLGSDAATVVVPLAEDSYLAVSRDFILDEENSAPGVRGSYGFGYAFVRNAEQGLFAYGPGEFDAAVELINFQVLESGQIRSRLIFVANRPVRMMNVELNPFDLGYRLADLLSLGLSSSLLTPIKNALERIPLSLGSFDPLGTYVSFANQLTGGLAARDLCISLEQLERDFLVQHFQQHYQMLVGSLLTWRQVPDWLDKSTLPAWVITGRNS
ncbi:MAG: hypothetical protein LC754_14250 [Acidobacteria bacterium]|nr:hypothetical protein [Acidobacteriota bacterium]